MRSPPPASLLGRMHRGLTAEETSPRRALPCASCRSRTSLLLEPLTGQKNYNSPPWQFAGHIMETGVGLMGAAGKGDGSGGWKWLQSAARAGKAAGTLRATREPGPAGNRDRNPQVGRWPLWSHCPPLGNSSWSAPEGGFGISSAAAGLHSSHASLASHNQEEIK